MSPKLPPVSGEETVRVLKRLGFVPIRQRGSHLVLKKHRMAFQRIPNRQVAHFCCKADPKRFHMIGF